jgi:AcrR family transcriptional regulator
MARPKADAGAAPTQDRILDAATASFAARGFAETRLEDVAEQVGIRRPSLLYHFATKEELYAAVIRRLFEQLGASLAAAISIQGSFAERVDAVTAGYLAHVRSNPSFAPLLLRELLDVLERFIVEEGGASVRRGLPVRAAILQLAMATLVRAASGPLEKPLWGEGEDLPALARVLFLADERSRP